ncbi:MAG TPA: NAD(P)/FAD-dependent oxidoreductase [Alphaproteobacteria bacterium]|nr:NAD(P)/FAD-dependent oxidoreductase [Alphaproteobacteria bacterium]
MVERVECVVIGAGAIGLAIARALALQGREVVVLEKAGQIGTETSSRNSEVIHAGMYYATGSLKATLCVRGKEMLYRYLPEHGVHHDRVGKLIVATEPDQLASLERLEKRAPENGVNDLTWLDEKTAKALEPELNCHAALLSPSTGTLDSHGLMLAYQGDAEDHGAVIAFNSPVVAGWIEKDGFLLEVGGAEPAQIACRILVNSAGLWAQEVARAIEGIPPESIPPRYLAKGCYFTLTGKPPFQHLIYPAPEVKFASLGLHVTVDLAGQVRFGPDVEWVDKIDYDVPAERAAKFYETIRHYYPGLKDGTLHPGYAGVRPKLQKPGGPPEDFLIQGPAGHGIANLVNLYGMESPGLTASLAIAEEVLSRLDGA